MPYASIIPAFFTVAVLSYLLGSLSFAILISRLYAGDDIRRHGSGNAGMTNILRTYGKKPAIATALGDFLKAVAAVYLSRWVFARFGVSLVDAGYISGFFVLLGHLFPVYFGFKGGKGVITVLGVILVVNPPVFLLVCVIFIPLVLLVRIVSLASVLGAVAFPILTYLAERFRGDDPRLDTLFAVFISLIILVMHRENIGRLLRGEEHRFGKRKKD